MKFQDTCLAFLTVCMWGSYFVIAKFGVAEFPPIIMCAIRVFFPIVFLTPFFYPSKKHIKGLLLLSVGITSEIALTLLGLKYIEGSITTIVFQLAVPFSALMAFLVFNEKLNKLQWSGMAVAFAGVVMIAETPSVESVLPVFLIAGSAFAWAVSNIIIKKMSAVSPLILVGWGAFFAFPQLLLLSFLFEDGQLDAIKTASITAWGAIAYIGIVSFILAQVFWYYLIGKYSVTKITPFLFFEPAIGLFLGYFLLSETLSWQKLLGCTLVVLGMIMIKFISNKKNDSVEICTSNC